MAALTITIDDQHFAELRDEAEARGTSPEAVARERLVAWFDAGHEHESRNRRLLERLRAGEPLDAGLVAELRQARAETGVWLTNERLAATIEEGRR